MKVYFMRHGESEYNVAQRINFDHTVEVNLTLTGKDQARQAAKKLAELRLDAIYVSEFLRTQETATIISKGRRIRIKIDRRLNEIKMAFEGDSAEKYTAMRRASGNILAFKPPRGESFLEIKNRLSQFLTDLKKEKYARVLIVTHEVVVQAARALFNELGDEDSLTTPIENCQYFMFDM